VGGIADDAIVVDWRRRSVVTGAGCATIGVVVALTSLFNACSLDSNGVGVVGNDAAIVDGTLPPLDSAEASAHDAIADVVRGDGCATVETSCLDGLDNDCNGLIDCADPACTAGYSCVPSPSGAFGGFGLYGDGRSSPCPTGYRQADTFEAPVFLPATCAPCTCTAEGASCGSAVISCNSGATCDPDGGATAVSVASCVDLDGGLAIDPTTSCALGIPTAIPGSCTSAGGAATLAPVTFGQLSRVCTAVAPQSGGCAAGAVCLANPPSGFHGACVFDETDGTALCPTGYPHAHVTTPNETSFADSRGCTSCSCIGPAGAACAGSATLYPAAECGDDAGAEGGAPIALPADGTCHPGISAGSEVIASSALDAAVVSQGSCAPSGGQPTGAVTPKNQTVYCCQN
jgi:hypothetical protein